MKSGVYGATDITSDLQTDLVSLGVGMKNDQFMEMIVKTSRNNQDMIPDDSHS
jgi:hypothetical protein